MWQFKDVLNGITKIRNETKKIVILAAESLMRPRHSIYSHTIIPEISNKEISDVIDIVGRKKPYMVNILGRLIVTLILREFSSSGIVYIICLQ